MPIEVRELQVSVEKTKEVAKDLEKRMDDAEKLLNKHDDMIKDLGQRVAKLEKAKK
jgi:predicted  nucleic acid-binding Zn-ribbon protein